MNLKSRTIMMVVVLAGVFSLAALIIDQSQSLAFETRVIRVYGEKGDVGSTRAVRIEPKNVWVRPGTTLIWNNWARENISIIFKEGPTCDAATQSKAGFELDSNTSCMVTSQDLPLGGTASMMFNKTGRFDYEVEVAGRKIRNAGSITVRPPGAE